MSKIMTTTSYLQLGYCCLLQPSTVGLGSLMCEIETILTTRILLFTAAFNYRLAGPGKSQSLACERVATRNYTYNSDIAVRCSLQTAAEVRHTCCRSDKSAVSSSSLPHKTGCTQTTNSTIPRSRLHGGGGGKKTLATK